MATLDSRMNGRRSMIGAIVGDVVGSRWEFGGCKTKEFVFLNSKCAPTDDSILTLAIGDALLATESCRETLGRETVRKLIEWWCAYPFAGYGAMFESWVAEGKGLPYNSWGNGSAMRVSFCGWAAKSLEEAKALADAVTRITHNHPEGISGATIVAECVYLAKCGFGIPAIRDHVEKNYRKIDFTLDEIRPTYEFDVSCQGSVPQAIEAFLESTSFEDAIRNAISLGGDSDTLGAICGAIAGAHWGVPKGIIDATNLFLDEKMKTMLVMCERRWA